MKSFRILAPVAITALALAACGSSSKSNAGSSTTTQPAAQPAATTLAPTTTTASGAAGGATVSSAQNATIGKAILVDSSGATLYVWDNDKTAGQSSCKGGCATAWPPLDVTGTPTYGPGLSAAMFSEVTGPNGEKQLAVNGKPLYTFKGYTTPGDTTGQGQGGFYVVGVDGKKIDSD